MAAKKTHAEKMKKLTIEIAEFLQKRDMFTMINIYSNNTRFSSDPAGNSSPETTKYGAVYVTKDCDVTEIIEYNNPETITMTFEGPLNHALNYESAKTENALQKLFNKYGLFFEMGYAWSLAAYKI